jgi:hypothetical protein
MIRGTGTGAQDSPFMRSLINQFINRFQEIPEGEE